MLCSLIALDDLDGRIVGHLGDQNVRDSFGERRQFFMLLADRAVVEIHDRDSRLGLGEDARGGERDACGGGEIPVKLHKRSPPREIKRSA